MSGAVPSIRIELAGFGSIGQYLARRLDEGGLPQARITAVSARDLEKAARNCASLRTPPKVVPLAELAERAEIIVECARPGRSARGDAHGAAEGPATYAS
jgi:aspartate dehydrogenase